MIKQNRKNSEIQRTFWWSPDGKEVGGMGENGEGINMCEMSVIKSHRDVKNSIGI